MGKKRILKSTPVTIDGHDVMEILVSDEDVWCAECCYNCCYQNWQPHSESDYDCCTIHGCTQDPHTFFLIERLDDK